MICPACHVELVKVSVGKTELDVCKNGCGGIWFDRFELQKMDEPHEFSTEELHKSISVENPSATDASQRLNCPRCGDFIMMRHYFSFKKEVEVDHCPKCAGYWLDEGELFKIRGQFDSEKERQSATENFLSKAIDLMSIQEGKASDK